MLQPSEATPLHQAQNQPARTVPVGPATWQQNICCWHACCTATLGMISQNAASAPVRPATERMLLTCPLHSNLRHNQRGHCLHQTHSTVTYYLLPTCPLHGNLRHRSATTLAPVRPAARQQNICCQRARYTATFSISRPKRYHC